MKEDWIYLTQIIIISIQTKLTQEFHMGTPLIIQYKNVHLTVEQRPPQCHATNYSTKREFFMFIDFKLSRNLFGNWSSRVFVRNAWIWSWFKSSCEHTINIIETIRVTLMQLEHQHGPFPHGYYETKCEHLYEYPSFWSVTFIPLVHNLRQIRPPL